MSEKGGDGVANDRVPGRTALQTVWWDIGCLTTEVVLRSLYHYGVGGRERIPRRGPLLFVSNHQSYLDPAIIGCAVRWRQFTAIAQEGLFRFAPFGWLLRSYGTIAIERGAGDAGPMKAALSELTAGRCVLVYPEGTRSPDGSLQAFRRGVLVLQRRAKVPIVPMGIDGATDVWPRGHKRPRLRGRVRVEVGSPISVARLAALDSEAALHLLESEVDRLRRLARSVLRRESRGQWPPEGPGDAARNGRAPIEAPTVPRPVAEAIG